ncbi:carboxypeptidase regulatory-like domain-containing protein [Micromonospora radicis]
MVVALIVGALLAIPATPALAATVNVIPGAVTVNAGSDATVTVQVTPGEGDTTAEISLTGLPAGVSCARGCGNVQFNGQAPRAQLLTLRANDNARNGSATVTVQVQPDNSDPATANIQLTVRGEQAPPTSAPPTTQAPQTVRSISGKVVNQAGEGVPNAYVLLKDSAGTQYDTTSNGDGNFRFTGTSDRPIAPGRIDLGASANNIREVVSFTANAGQSITGRRITLAIAASTSPTPTPSTSESAPPTEDPFDDVFPEDEETPGESAVVQTQASNDESGGFGSWLLVLLGGLFVAVGVGTIVLLWMKRKENDDAEADGDAPAGAPAGAVPAARGSFVGADDQTRVVNRVGGTPDPTMVGGPGLSNAPTMMHQPVVDDVPPDPYGAPPQPYGAAGAAGPNWSGGGYGEEPGGYGAPGYGNAPSSGGGYGNAPSSGGGYGNSPSSGSGYGSRDYGAGSGGSDYPPARGAPGYGERYDEPTGRYNGEETRYPAAADPYATGVYEPEAGSGGYRPAESTGYGPAESTGYGPAESTGYGRGEPAGGYGRNEPAGGYGQSDSTRRYGQGEPTGGYDQGNPAGGYGQGYGPADATRGYGQGEPTGGYGQSDPAGGYGQGDRGYGPADSTSGYGQGEATGGYGQQPGGAYGPGGYDQAGGYGQEPPQQRGGYDNAYEPGGAYGQGGYEQSGGYGQEPPRQRGSYEQGGYDQGAGYGDPAQAGRGRPDNPPERGGRRLDWLDD